MWLNLTLQVLPTGIANLRRKLVGREVWLMWLVAPPVATFTV